ncbi:MAG: protein kinase [Myxococcales bacterium]
MALSRDRIIALGTSPYLHEQSALNFAVATLPDRDPFRLWGLVDLVDPGGRRYDLDLVVIGFHAVYLIEIKSHPGRIKGDVVDWTVEFPDGGRTTLEHPGRLAEHKARVLASLLQKEMAGSNQRSPWVQHLIFASAEGVDLQLTGAANNHVVTRTNFLRALQFGEYPGVSAQALRHEIDRPQARETVKALMALGLRPSHASRKVNDLILGKLLVENENYQDHLARHESIPSIQARVRTYQVAQGVTLERRNQLVNAAEREARHLTLLSDHPNILKLRSYLAHGPTNAPCIVFEHLEGELPLDAFLRTNPDLTMDDRVSIVTRVGEGLAYCHRKSILHRGLAPSSVLVRRNPEDSKKLDVRLFNFQLATQTEATSGAVPPTSHLSAWLRSNEDVYVAPEVLEKPENANIASDLFSLGAVAYLILVGRPPGQSLLERETLFRRGYLSPATARDELAAGLKAAGLDQSAAGGPTLDGLENVMEFATARNPINRGDDVVFWLGEFAGALRSTAEAPTQSYVDPLEAKRNDEIAPEILVEAVLGTGSTARTLRIHTEDGTFALKVSLSSELDTRLRHEGDILSALHKDGRLSDRIVRLHQVMQIGGRTCLRLTDAGQTLAHLLADEGAQSIDYAKRWGDDLLRALEHLEDLGIQHRDIKPGNLGILSGDQKRKRNLLLFDFSLSAADASAVRLGTPAYRDPFLVQRGSWDAAADRYSAAITLHELLTGERPRWGASDIASAMEGEVTLAAERFDATVRDRLVAFFRQALARDVGVRFPSADAMKTQWIACFASTTSSAASGFAVSATGFVDSGAASVMQASQVPAATADPVSSLTAAMPDGLNLQTSIESLPLSARAKNGLYRVSALRVADLLRLPNNQLSAMRGVGRGTAREILEFIRRPELEALRTALPPVTVHAPDGSDGETPGRDASDRVASPTLERSLDGWLNAALPPVTKKQGEKPLQHVRHLWGLDQLQGRQIVSVVDLATTLGVTRPLIYQAIEKMRQHWRTLPFLEELTSLVEAALERTGGYASLASLGAEITQALDRPQPAIPGDKRAEALVRIVVETGGSLQLARLDWLDRALWVVPTDSDLRALKSMGAQADELAQAEPLLSPGGALVRLRAVQDLGALATVADEALVALAVAASKTAAKSARLEIYPRGLSLDRSLDLCLSSLPPAGLEPVMVAQIIGARYPAAAPVPQDGQLTEALVARGYIYDAPSGKFNRRAVSVMPSTVGAISRAPTTHTSRVEKMDPVAVEFARDIEIREKRGSFCVLEVQPARAQEAALEMSRRLRVPDVSLEAALVKAMETVVAEKEIDLETVFATDRMGPKGAEWPNLKQLMELASERVLADLKTHTEPLILTNPGLLARYGLGKFLKGLVEHARGDAAPAVFLLVPSGEEAGSSVRIPHPAGDLPVPLTSPAQHLSVPDSWLRNLDKGRPRSRTPVAGSAP